MIPELGIAPMLGKIPGWDILDMVPGWDMFGMILEWDMLDKTPGLDRLGMVLEWDILMQAIPVWGKALAAVELQDDSSCHGILLDMRKHSFRLDQSRFHCSGRCLACSCFHLKV